MCVCVCVCVGGEGREWEREWFYISCLSRAITSTREGRRQEVNASGFGQNLETPARVRAPALPPAMLLFWAAVHFWAPGPAPQARPKATQDLCKEHSTQVPKLLAKPPSLRPLQKERQASQLPGTVLCGIPNRRHRGTRWIPQVMNPNWSLSHFQAHTSSMCPSDRSSWLGLESKAVVRTLALLSNSEHQGQQGPRGTLEEKAQGFPLLHHKRGYPPATPHTHAHRHIQTHNTNTHTQHTQMHTRIQTHNTHIYIQHTHTHAPRWQGPVRLAPVGSYTEAGAQWARWACGDEGCPMPALVLLADFWKPCIFLLFLLGTNWWSQFLCLRDWLCESLPICQQQEEGREPLPEPGVPALICCEDAGVFSGPREDKPSQACPTLVPSCRPDKGQCILCDWSLLRPARAP